MNFSIELNQASAAVLLRCLGYGQDAISAEEENTGVAEVLDFNIQMLRRQVCSQMSRQVISQTADTLTRNKERNDDF